MTAAPRLDPAPPAPTLTLSPTPVERASLLPWLAALGVLVVGLLLVGPWPVGVFFDDGVYAILARALATGEGLRYLHLPGAPAATHYPPGYPVLLALLWRVGPEFPENVWLLKATNVVLLALATALAARFAERRLGLTSASATVATLVSVVALPLLSFVLVLFSEPLFLALLFPTLALCERAVDTGRTRDAAIAAAATGVLFLVRTVGGALLPPLVLLLLVRRHPRAAAAAALVGAAFVLPWQLWVSAHAAELPPELQGNYGPYLAWMTDAWARQGADFVTATVARNLTTIAEALGLMFVPRPLRPVQGVVVAGMLAAFALGLAVVARRAPATAGFLAGYLAIVLLWPYAPYRFLWGVWPLLALVVALGLHRLVAARPTRPAARVLRLAALATTALGLAGYGAYNAKGFRLGWYESAQREEAEIAVPAARWIAAHVPKDDVVATDYGPLTWLYTGRRAVPTGSFTPEEYLIPATVARAAEDARIVMGTYDVRWLIIASRGVGSAPAAEFLAGRTPPEIVLVDTLDTGGAVFVPAPRPAR